MAEPSTPDSSAPDSFFGLVGRTPLMLELFRQLEVVSPLTVPILIEGEAGSGKGATALALHRMGAHAMGPFRSLNVAEVSPALFESELFGLEEGAFSGAFDRRAGAAVEAEGGTLLIEAIESLPPANQRALERFLVTHEVRPVGSSESRTLDLRVIVTSALNRVTSRTSSPLLPELAAALSAFTLRIPPLRDRLDDLPLLSRHFMRESMIRHAKTVAGIEEEALAYLLAYPWPGNVQELEEEMDRAVILTPAGEKVGARVLSRRVNPTLPHEDPEELESV